MEWCRNQHATDETRELLTPSLVHGTALHRKTTIFVERELIHQGDVAGNVKLSRQANMAMIDAVDGIGVFIGTIQKWLDGYQLPGSETLVFLGEAWRIPLPAPNPSSRGKFAPKLPQPRWHKSREKIRGTRPPIPLAQASEGLPVPPF